jgi:hypothetical protein
MERGRTPRTPPGTRPARALGRAHPGHAAQARRSTSWHASTRRTTRTSRAGPERHAGIRDVRRQTRRPHAKPIAPPASDQKSRGWWTIPAAGPKTAPRARSRSHPTATERAHRRRRGLGSGPRPSGRSGRACRSGGRAARGKGRRLPRSEALGTWRERASATGRHSTRPGPRRHNARKDYIIMTPATRSSPTSSSSRAPVEAAPRSSSCGTPRGSAATRQRAQGPGRRA